MRVAENNPTRCPKCIGGRLLIDTLSDETYCINCGWRQTKRQHSNDHHPDASKLRQVSTLRLNQAEMDPIPDSPNATISLARLLKWLEDDES